LKQLPLFEKLLAQGACSEAQRTRRQRILESYREASLSEKRQLMLDHLQGLAASTLGIGNPASVPHDEALFDLGLDSLTSLELRSSLESSLQIKVPSSLVFDYPTLRKLTDYFIGMLSSGQVQQKSPDLRAVAGLEITETEATDFTDADEGNDSCEDAGHEQISGLLQSVNELSAELDRW
jgi:acyl carrier protein